VINLLQEVVSYMIQILSALQHLHSQQKCFEIGKLREKNIYLSNFYNKVYVDPGFYHGEGERYQNYYNAPEGSKSIQSDIYAAGFIFFRLLTFYTPNKIQEIFDKKYNRNSFGKLFQKKYDYVSNFKQELLHLKGTTTFTTSILNIIIQMIDYNPRNRPIISDIISELKEIQKPLKSKVSLNWKLQNKYENLSEFQKIILQHDDFRQFLKAFLRFVQSFLLTQKGRNLQWKQFYFSKMFKFLKI
jgi:serine/threonine protein kinase